MQRAYGIEIPQTLEDVCDPGRMGLLVYDMQVGVLSQLPTAAEVSARVGEVLRAAREGGYRVLFTRHLSLPSGQRAVMVVCEGSGPFLSWTQASVS